MNNMPKSLLGNTLSDQAIIVPRRHEQSVSKDVHRTLVSEQAVPLRGAFQRLPGIMNAIQSLAFMIPSTTKLALVIDDDHLSKQDIAVLRDIVISRTYNNRDIPDNVHLVVVTDSSPALFREALGDKVIFKPIQPRQQSSELTA